MNSAQSLGRSSNECLNRFAAQRVQDQWNDHAACLLSDLRGSLAQHPLGPGANRNIAALARQLSRYRLAHATAATRDDCFLALQLQIHAFSSVEVVRFFPFYC